MSTTTVATLQTQLTEVEAAISAVLTAGQSYQIGPKVFRRADLAELRQWRKELKAELNELNGGSRTNAAYLRRR